MVEIIARNIEKLLICYIKDNDFDINNILNSYSNLFCCQIKYDKYSQSVTGAAAKVICEYQKFVYKIASYAKEKDGKSPRLTNAEKKELEVVFEVKKGSSELFADFTKQLAEILQKIPKKYVTSVCIVFVLSICMAYCFNLYLKHVEAIYDKKIIEEAIDKLSKTDDKLTDILETTQKVFLESIADIDNSVEYQGIEYTQDDLKEIIKEKYHNKPVNKQIKTIEGIFVVTQINIKKHYIIIENNNDIQRILYADDLVSSMQQFKKHFKQAIDDEGKQFYIKAVYVVQNNKKKDLILSDIKAVESE